MAESCLLYYITDRTQFPGDETARRRALLEKIAEAARAGVDYIQLREKDLNTRELEALAREVLGIARAFDELRTEHQELRTRQRTRLLINSRTDVALAVGADGVHLRADDLSASEVRAIWNQARQGNEVSLSGVGAPVIAVSCHTTADIVHAESDGASFAVFAPVFEKRDRPATRRAGLDALRDACRAKIPVLALGGVTLENAAACMEAGAAGIAAIRLFQENRVDEVVHALRAR